MTFETGAIDYHPGLDDPWLLVSFVMVALVAAGLTAFAKRSSGLVVLSSLAMVAVSPFLFAWTLHALYLVVNSDTERILCTHWVRRGLLPEIFAGLGVGVGLILGPRRKPRPLVEGGHA